MWVLRYGLPALLAVAGFVLLLTVQGSTRWTASRCASAPPWPDERPD